MVFKILTCALAFVLVTSDSASAECWHRYRGSKNGDTMLLVPPGTTIKYKPNGVPVSVPLPEPDPQDQLPTQPQPIPKPSVSHSKDVCNLPTCWGKPNTECLFKDFTPSANCGQVLTVGLSTEEKKAIVDLHNRLRMKVARGEELRGAPGPQPAATNMQMLEWDEELAQTAQKWASQCIFQHDKCRDLPRYEVGQNLAARSTSYRPGFEQFTTDMLVNMWYDEVRYYNRNSVHRFDGLAGAGGEQTGHYTQLVWAKTNRIGCGAIRNYQGGDYTFTLACNYGPSGNFMNQPVYNTQLQTQPQMQIQPRSNPQPQGQIQPRPKSQPELTIQPQPVTKPSISHSKDVCNLPTCRGKPNTECLFKDFTPSANCGQVLTVGLSTEEKKAIVDLHNELRMKVARGQELRGAPGPQPPATDMQTLEWDEELAQTAQKWASQCIFQHDQCRHLPRFQVGQNLAWRGNTSKQGFSQITAEILVKDWYDEVQYYNRNSVHRFNSLYGAGGEQTGHYTQLVWAKTNRIGCGAIRNYQGGYYKFTLACNYGPSGNFMNQPVYRTQ
ncbi:ancylostoma secreted protein-like [Trichogramma pretiosum]|uniref:ancylostoma secreted protein-like n=1 Tax=Trichogramma pretiosum TaxID=7493 RepID=UPI000C71C3FA|nr:ancylostoma secreted protein-like [Trichogramma pretiosum]